MFTIRTLILLGRSFFNVLELPPHRPWSKRTATIAYVAYLLIIIIPTIVFVSEQDDFLRGVIIGSFQFFLGPVIQILGVRKLSRHTAC